MTFMCPVLKLVWLDIAPNPDTVVMSGDTVFLAHAATVERAQQGRAREPESPQEGTTTRG